MNVKFLQNISTVQKCLRIEYLSESHASPFSFRINYVHAIYLSDMYRNLMVVKMVVMIKTFLNIKHCMDIYKSVHNDWSWSSQLRQESLVYCIQENIRPSFHPGCQQMNLRQGKFQCLINKLSLFKHNCLWENSKRGETVYKCRRTKNYTGQK